MVEKAGINVDHLVELLVKNAAAELTTFYYYTILRCNLIDSREKGSKRSQRPLALKTVITLRLLFPAYTSWEASSQKT